MMAAMAPSTAVRETMLVHATRGATIALLLLALLGPGAAAAGNAAVTSIAFEHAVLGDLGIGVDAAPSAASQLDEGIAFSGSSDLAFDAPGGDFEGFSGGTVAHNGALTLTVAGRAHSLDSFELRVAADPMELELFDAGGRRWLLFQDSQPLVADGELDLQNIDVNVAPELAAMLGRPELAGSYLGRAHLRVAAPPAAAGAGATTQAGLGPCDVVSTPDRDVALIDIGTVSQLAREPGGRVALTFSAQLRNVGTSSILWLEAIEPDGLPSEVGEHPFLALHVYRIADGRITQVGRSDVKHAFFSVNSNCPCSGGHVIYSSCEDTYGASTNANRQHLAPREEVSAGTGDWTRLGSHFDGSPVDDFRHHGGNNEHDAFEHRLLVDEGALLAGGDYYVGAWYIIRDDVDLFNSMAYDPVLPSFGGSTWAFTTLGGLVNGSILDQFVDPVTPPPGSSNRVVDTGEGRLQLAVSTTDLGGGVHHYEFALMNFDFDRQIESFTLPLGPDITASNVSFADADAEPLNDWTAAAGPLSITWSSTAGNEMDWGTLYSFGFDANAPPTETTATLGVLEAGGPSSIQLGGTGPAAPTAVPAHGSALWPLAASLALLALAARRLRSRR
jgi:hypothetical protein